MKFMTSTSKRKKYHIIISINTKKAFDKIQHRCMIKKEKVSVNQEYKEVSSMLATYDQEKGKDISSEASYSTLYWKFQPGKEGREGGRDGGIDKSPFTDHMILHRNNPKEYTHTQYQS